MYYRNIILTLVLLASYASMAQPLDKYFLIKDLKQDWIINSDKTFKSFEKKGNVRTIHFLLDPDHYKGMLFKASSSEAFSFYLNHKLLLHDKRLVFLNLDSLHKLYPSPWLISIHQRSHLAWLNTHVVSTKAMSIPLLSEPRKGNFFLDFSILSSILLAIFFVVLLRTNPRLTIDYLNLVRLFSLQEREDSVIEQSYIV